MDQLPDSDSTSSLMKELSRKEIWSVWQTGRQGGSLSEDQARLYQVMLDHPELYDLWDRLIYATEEEVLRDGTNPVLHIMFHSIIENQIALDQPPAVRQVLNALMQKRLNRHQAVHLIAEILTHEVYHILKDKRPYDQRNYVRGLRKLPLTVPSPRPQKKG